MNLFDYLEKSGETQTSFALRVEATQGRISQLLAGETPSLDLAQRIFIETKGKVGLEDWPVITKKAA